MRLLARAVLLLFILFPPLATAQEVPLTNWTVPPYRGSSASGGLTTMSDVTPGIGFVGVAPCRLVDTRQAGFPAGYGTPSLSAGVPRNFDLNSDPLCTGIPAGVDAYSLNVTVTNTQGPGFILIYPQGGAQPPVSTVNYVAGQTIANAAVVPAGTGGGVTVIAGVSGTNLIIDINGYFTDQYNAGVSFHAVSSTVAPAILAENTSQLNDAVAIQGVITSTNPGANAVAVRGTNNSTSDKGGGVLGTHNGSAFGVWGISVSGSGVFGEARAATGAGKGVYGLTASSSVGAAGVFGVDGSGPTVPSSGFPFASAGVRGESKSKIGVLGLTETAEGVRGAVVNSSGDSIAAGVLGIDVGAAKYGVYSIGPAFVQGNLTVTGTISAAMKPFIQPHPHDPSKQIRYVSLEGPHSEVYFRGTAQVSQGVTRIPIPEDFRLVADGRTYSTIVTPVGGMASIAVLAESEEGIIVQASRDVKIHYVVYAEREAMRNPEPIVANVDFLPEPGGDFLTRLPDSYRQLMIQNGTLNPDGTVNMDTARRLGWDKEWEKQGRPVQQPAPQ